MEMWWEVALLLGVLTGGNCAPLGNHSATLQEEAILAAIHSYSSREHDTSSGSVFKLVDSGTKLENTTDPTRLTFTIKETNCQKPLENNIENCHFKDGGIVKNCSAFITGDKANSTAIKCDPVVSKIVKNCSAFITGDKANSTAIKCDPVVSKPLFLSSRRHTDWRENRNDQKERKGDEQQPDVLKDTLDKMMTNLTGSIAPLSCFPCVLCGLNNSCKK
ncbi:cathelicidin antimicrobial peptide-like [Ambystoma mexicanum]|uniref:cathelicidin antimicrobial peptide-like n=1 Tax=Ambystoma mexicanum TaxID=8296 RepID=UPI0037E8E176